MNEKAFLNLLRVLNTVRSKKKYRTSFDMILYLEDHALGEIPDKKDINLPLTCGTTACAAGYAGLDEWFQKKGFYLFIDNDDAKVTYRSFTGFEALKNFFNISLEDVKFLFGPELRDNIDDVILRIEKYYQANKA